MLSPSLSFTLITPKKKKRKRKKKDFVLLVWHTAHQLFFFPVEQSYSTLLIHSTFWESGWLFILHFLKGFCES